MAGQNSVVQPAIKDTVAPSSSTLCEIGGIPVDLFSCRKLTDWDYLGTNTLSRQNEARRTLAPGDPFTCCH